MKNNQGWGKEGVKGAAGNRGEVPQNRGKKGLQTRKRKRKLNDEKSSQSQQQEGPCQTDPIKKPKSKGE